MDEARKRPLRIFLCHASQDKPLVRKLSRRLENEGWIDVWLDEKKLLPGQDWRLAIEEAVEASDVIIICLSSNSVSKEGFVQKELRYAREMALEKPEEVIFLVPLRLENCDVPRGLRIYQWGDYFGEKLDQTYSALLQSLKLRYEQSLRLEEERSRQEAEKQRREASERIERERAEREAEERVRQEVEKHWREVDEKIRHERAEREAAEQAAREMAEREAEHRARQEAEEQKREIDERIERRRVEREAVEKAAQQKGDYKHIKKAPHQEDAVIINSLLRQVLICAQNIMGDNDLNAVLSTSGLERFISNFPPDNLELSIQASQYAKLNQNIEEFYGRAGKGVLRRIGRASFQYGLREQATLMGIAGVALKLLSEKQRIKFILNGMVEALKNSNPQVNAWVDESGDRLAYVEFTCAICHSRHSETPICYLYVGSISEAVQWATGTEHEVVETHCLAKGDRYCRFEIE